MSLGGGEKGGSREREKGVAFPNPGFIPVPPPSSMHSSPHQQIGNPAVNGRKNIPAPLEVKVAMLDVEILAVLPPNAKNGSSLKAVYI